MERLIQMNTGAVLKVKLSGARRQTYINDTLYRTVAKVLPVIAPEMSVPMF